MVKSAYRVVQILEVVSSSSAGLKHSEIADLLGIPKGSLSLLLSDLVAQEYLSQDKDGRRYFLGPQILVIAKRYLAGLDVAQLGRPILKKMVADSGECVEIGMRRGNDLLMVCREDCSRPLRSVIQIGDRAPLYSTAAGKAILAFLPPEELEEYLSGVRFRAFTKRTIVNPKILRRELETIRSGRIAYSREELNEGVIAMGLPVFDADGSVHASVVIPVPTIRFNEVKERKVELALRQGASTLSHKLGFIERTTPLYEGNIRGKLATGRKRKIQTEGGCSR
ncbi:MAG: IclR family transcriptional regulator [Desulfobacteraceae bacterium]|nr:MAG: IclR family transcriptional regulator [Desulfobacteraceae bacterium]